jgi:hypothetical protein
MSPDVFTTALDKLSVLVLCHIYSRTPLNPYPSGCIYIHVSISIDDESHVFNKSNAQF